MLQHIIELILFTEISTLHCFSYLQWKLSPYNPDTPPSALKCQYLQPAGKQQQQHSEPGVETSFVGFLLQVSIRL